MNILPYLPYKFRVKTFLYERERFAFGTIENVYGYCRKNYRLRKGYGYNRIANTQLFCVEIRLDAEDKFDGGKSITIEMESIKGSRDCHATNKKATEDAKKYQDLIGKRAKIYCNPKNEWSFIRAIEEEG